MNKKTVDFDFWSNLYKEVVGEELEWIAIEDLPAETRAAIEYFGNMGEDENE